MAPTKQKGDMAELRVASDLVRQGYQVAIPFGEDSDFDLVLMRDERFERVQVKYFRSDGQVIVVRCVSLSMTGGRVKRKKHYTASTIDWLAVYDPTSDCCYYVPSDLLGPGRSNIYLRLTPTRNGQQRRINQARDYLTIPAITPD